ncbi:MAG: hypothetical protein AABZ14_04990 [Candidatus Margulisiibacteriota bacterium]
MLKNKIISVKTDTAMQSKHTIEIGQNEPLFVNLRRGHLPYERITRPLPQGTEIGDTIFLKLEVRGTILTFSATITDMWESTDTRYKDAKDIVLGSISEIFEKNGKPVHGTDRNGNNVEEKPVVPQMAPDSPEYYLAYLRNSDHINMLEPTGDDPRSPVHDKDDALQELADEYNRIGQHGEKDWYVKGGKVTNENKEAKEYANTLEGYLRGD